MSSFRWSVQSPLEALDAFISHVGLEFTAGSVTDLATLRTLRPLSPLGWSLPDTAAILVEKGLASFSDGRFIIPHDDFVTLEEEGINDFSELAAGSPFALELESIGSVGTPSFGVRVQFFNGLYPVPVERLGAFVRYRDTIYRLNASSYRMLEAVDRLNALTAAEKGSTTALTATALIQQFSFEVGAQLDRLLQNERIVIAPSIGLDIVAESGGRISYAPKIPNVDDAGLQKAFFAADEVQSVLTVQPTDGSRVRVVLDEPQQEVLRRMQRVRHLGGTEKAEVMRNPQAVFDGVADAVDLSGLSKRVKGIGDFPFVVQPFSRAGIFEDEPGAQPGKTPLDAGLVCTYADGTREEVKFANRDDLLALHEKVKAAWQDGSRQVEYQGKQISIDAPLVHAFDELADRVMRKPSKPKEDTSQGQYLLIYTNEEDVEFEQETSLKAVAKPVLPRSLTADLKPHQIDGFEWLHRNYVGGRSGCLLADDMGLGKTLQMLTFIAWVLENRETVLRSGRRLDGPVLVIAPVILLENATWAGDMARFFANHGEIFGRTLVLRDRELKRLRVTTAGRETAIGAPVLDLDAISAFDIVFTNYETVTNYQHSLAHIPWSIVVTDEAQEYKTPSTKISHAMKGLNPDFRVACTGTPVETKLLDAWNLFDFLQPGLLRSAKEFVQTYDIDASVAKSGDTSAALEPLKRQLRFTRPDAFVIRREKTQLVGLPHKIEHVVKAPLSEKQRELHQQTMQRLRSGSPKDHPFSLLHALLKTYQHPALLDATDYERNHTALLRDCPKLQVVIETLTTIREQNQKALVFTRSVAMQQLLASTFRQHFGLDVGIVNGASPKKGETHSGRMSRERTISGFQDSPGFNVLILSPDVAGIGLTLVEANHVIHYGRWWNPAKESQATDRVYRIGQTRNVHVYYPIAVDPRGEFQSFDEKLDGLLTRRKALAEDFLAPLPAEDELGVELLSDLAAGASDGPPTPVQPLLFEDVRRLHWEPFEAFVAAVETSRGSNVILTPKSGDDGIDVIADDGREVALMQCKHTRWGQTFDADAVTEVLSGFDRYRMRLGGRASSRTFRPVLVATGTFSKAARRAAAERGVKLFDQDDIAAFVKTSPVTAVDVDAAGARRASNLHAVYEELSSWCLR